jgi:putative endonuclease
MLHSEGKGAKYTRMFKPVRIAQCWKLLDSKAQAMKIEAFIKKKPKSFKENLIKNPRMLKRTLLKKYGCNFKIIKADSIFI